MDLRQVAETNPAFPPVVFFVMGTPDEAEDFFADLWPEATVVADADKTFYDAFGVERGGLLALARPEVLVCGIRAAGKGATVSKPQGDTRTLPTAFLVQGDQVVWTYRGRHVGDHPDWAKVAQLAVPA